MNSQDFLASVLILTSLMALATLAEHAIPLKTGTATVSTRRRGRLRANLGMTAVTFLLGWGLTALAAFAAYALPSQAPLPLASSGLPVAAQWLVAVVVLDFSFGYLAHRLMHEWPLLWRFHRVHHADAFVDVTTTYRTHPVETVWRFAFMTAPILLFGIPAGALVLYRSLSAINGILEHANLRVPAALDSALTLLWVTPNMHKVHHSRDASETDTNYSNIFSLHDRLFGSFTPSDRAFTVSYGLDDIPDAAEPESTRKLLALPFSASPAASRPLCA